MTSVEQRYNYYTRHRQHVLTGNIDVKCTSPHHFPQTHFSKYSEWTNVCQHPSAYHCDSFCCSSRLRQSHLHRMRERCNALNRVGHVWSSLHKESETSRYVGALSINSAIICYFFASCGHYLEQLTATDAIDIFSHNYISRSLPKSTTNYVRTEWSF